MGFETHAKLNDARDIKEIRQEIVNGFLTLEWTIVRENGNCFSVALKDRIDTGWDEDFMVCVTDHVYLLEHRWTLNSTKNIHEIIEHSLGYVYPHLEWEEV